MRFEDRVHISTVCVAASLHLVITVVSWILSLGKTVSETANLLILSYMNISKLRVGFGALLLEDFTTFLKLSRLFFLKFRG